MVFNSIFSPKSVNIDKIQDIIDDVRKKLKNNKYNLIDFDKINKDAKNLGKQFTGLGDSLRGLHNEQQVLAVATDLVSSNIKKQAKETAILTVKNLALKAATFLAAAAISYLATKVIQYAIDKYDAYVNRIEYATEAVNEHKENLQNAKSELESVNTTLEDNKKKIEEIQSKGVLTITDEADIANLEEENKKLQRQVELLREKVALEQDSEIRAARDLYNTAIKDSGLPQYTNTYSQYKTSMLEGMSTENAKYYAEQSKDINQLIASLNVLTKARDEARQAGEDELALSYDSYIDTAKNNLLELATTYDTVMSGLASSTDENDKAIVASLQGSYDTIMNLLNPESWFNDKFNSIPDEVKKVFNDIISNSKDSVADVTDILKGMADNDELPSAFDELSSKSKDKLRDVIDSFVDVGYSYETISASIVDALTGIGVATENLAFSAKSWTDINESIDGVQTAYKNLSEAVTEYNKHGYLSMDTLQALLTMNDSYLACLVNQNGQLKLNMSSFQDLATAQLESAKATAIAQAIEELKNVADQDEISVSAGSAQALANKGKVVAQLANQYVNLANCASLAAQAEALADAYTGAMTRNAGAATKIMQGLNAKLGLINSAMKGVNSSATGAARSLGGFNDKSNSAAEAAKKLKEALEEQKDALEKQKKEIEKQNDVLKAQGEAIKKEIEKRIDALKDQKDAASDAIDAEIDRLKELKEQQDKVYEDQIDALNEKKDALQKANDEEDRAIQLAQLQEELERAKNQRTARVYTHQTGFTWQTDENAVQEAQNNLDDQMREWNREDAIQAVEDEIDAIEKLKDAFDEESEARTDALEKEKDALEKRYDAEIDKLEDLKDKYADAISLIGMSWEEYQAQLDAAAMASGMSLGAMSDYLGSYTNSIVENMQALSDVEAQITAIEEQINAASKAASEASSGGGGGGGSTLPSMMLTTLDSLKEKIKECGEENNSLSTTLVGLQTELENAVFGSTAYEDAVDGIKTTNTELGENLLTLNGLMDEYAQTVIADSSLSQEARDTEFQSVIDMLAGYGVSYDTLNTYLSTYLAKVQETYGAASVEYQSAATDIGYVQAALNESIGPFGSYIDKINSTASEIETLRGQEADLTTATNTLTEGTAAHFHALDQLGTVQSDISAKQQELTSYIDEAKTAIDNATLATDEAKESQLLYLDSLIQSLQPKIDDKTATDEQAASEQNATEKTKELTSAAKEANEQATPAFQSVGAAGKQAGDDIANGFNNAASSVRSARESIEEECAKIAKAIENANKTTANAGSGVAGAHATGSRYIQKTGIHQVDEEGPEAIVRKPQAGRYTYLERGDMVAPAYASKNLWDVATNPDNFIDRHLGGLGKYVYPSVSNKTEQNSVSIGDVIIQQPVGDVNSLARAIQRDFPNVAMKELNKR